MCYANHEKCRRKTTERIEPPYQENIRTLKKRKLQIFGNTEIRHHQQKERISTIRVPQKSRKTRNQTLQQKSQKGKIRVQSP